MSTPIEDELRAVLHERADAVERTPDPWAVTTRAIDAERRHRRRVAGGVAAVLLTIGVGTGAALTAGPGQSHDATVPAGKVWSGPPAKGGSTSWATRGSLATDDQFLAGVRKRLAPYYSGDARVVYAGDVRGFRVVLAVGTPRDRSSEESAVLGIQMAGPAGSPAGRLGQPQRRYVIGDEHTLAWSPSGRAGHRAPVLVLTDSSVTRGAISPEPTYHRDGTVTRDWRTFTPTNGVWVGETGPRGAGLVAVRVDGRAITPFVTSDHSILIPPGPAGELVADFAQSHVVPTTDVRATVLFRGRIAAPMSYRVGGAHGGTERPRRVLVTYALLSLPDGTTFRSVQAEAEQPGGGVAEWRPIDGEVVPAEGARDWPAVFTGLGGPPEQPVLVVAPGADRAVLHGPQGQRLAVPLDSRGVGHRLADQPTLPGWPTGWRVEVVRDGQHQSFPVRTQDEEDLLARNAH